MATRRGRVGRAAALAGLALAVAGCWAMPGQGPDRGAYNEVESVVTAESAPRLRRAWEADLATGARVGDPVMSTAGVHAESGSSVHGVSPGTGEVLWSVPSPGWYEGQPVTDGGRVLFPFSYGGPGDGWLWLDGRTGERLADSAPGGGNAEVITDTHLVGRTFDYSGAQTGAVIIDVLDRRDSSRWWGLVGLEPLQGQGPPLTVGRDLVFESGWGPVGNEEEPTASSGVRAFALAGVRQDCGPQIAPTFACPTWATPFDEFGTPVTSPVLAPGETALYVGTDAGKVVALDPADGAVLWSVDIGGVPSDDPALAEGVLYVPRRDGHLVALPVDRCPERCGPAWSADLGSPAGQPAVAGGAVVVGTEAGDVAAFAADGCGGRRRCRPLWRDAVGAAVTGDPAISGGQIVVGTADGRLVAYAPTPA